MLFRFLALLDVWILSIKLIQHSQIHPQSPPKPITVVKRRHDLLIIDFYLTWKILSDYHPPLTNHSHLLIEYSHNHDSLQKYRISSEAPPQIDVLVGQIFHCLKRSDTGCLMLDKHKQRIDLFIQHPGTSI